MDLYNSAYSSDDVILWWEKAPGKEVVLQALCHFVEAKTRKTSDEEMTLVDIGCGTGYLLNRIYNKYPQIRLIGVDLSEKATQKGKILYPHIDLRCEDGSHTNIADSSCSILIGYGCYEHFTDPVAGLLEASRILKPGGVFFCMIPTLGIDRTDRTDEGWYEEKEMPGQPIRQMQWNLKRETWEKYFGQTGLLLSDIGYASSFGALKPGVFYFGSRMAQ